MNSHEFSPAEHAPDDCFFQYFNFKERLKYNGTAGQIYLLWVKRGVVSLCINHDIIHVVEGSILILPFQNVLNIEHGSNIDLSANLFLFDIVKILGHELNSTHITDKEKSLLANLQIEPTRFQGDTIQDVLACLDLLKYDFSNAPASIKETILFIDCIRLFNRLSKIESQRAPIFSVSIHNDESNIMTKILDYIYENYSTASLTEIASYLHYTPTYLSNLISYRYGKSFSSLLLRTQACSCKTDVKLIPVLFSSGDMFINRLVRVILDSFARLSVCMAKHLKNIVKQ